ncbi:MAG: virulence RhuM family protein [Bacilli bacterium]|nr:virulence RhuM family protein [Bacilli bacterium]
MNKNIIGNEKDIIFYSTDDGQTKIEVTLQDDNVWLNTISLANLFEVDRSVITKHINNIYKEEELMESSTCAKIAHVGNNGNQVYNTKYYNLDMIISIGFRVNSKKAIKFRTWANRILKEYLIKGFVLNDDRFLKGNKVNDKYFEELLERIKLIRTSERMFYQKITDIFAECSIDYDKNDERAIKFYKTIQNKFHYAITHNTAAEIIYNRVDSKKENMGLTNWKNSPTGKILKSDVSIAKNYLNKDELSELNDLVNIYLDVAENRAKRKIIMTMEDWIKSVDDIFKINYYDVLDNNGVISHNKALEKAEKEYEKYKIIQDKKYVSDFDKLLLETYQIREGDR